MGISSATAVAAGGNFALALTPDGRVLAWGDNYEGELGDGTRTSRSIPRVVAGLPRITAIAAGGQHALALTADGHVFAWGFNYHGELGTGAPVGAIATRAAIVPGLANVTGIEAGTYSSYAIMTGGAVRAWGANYSAQLGLGSAGADVTTPQPVSGLDSVNSLSAGSSQVLALRSDGSVWNWGSALTVPTPLAVPHARAIAAGETHSLLALTDGRVMAFGSDERGESGQGAINASTPPAIVNGIAGAVAVSAGQETSFAVLHDGTVLAWGLSTNHDLGIPNPPLWSEVTPTPVANVSQVTALDAGWAFSLAITHGSGYWMLGANGAVYAFGNAARLGSAKLSNAVALAPTPTEHGYWIVDSAGHVAGFGDAPNLGSASGLGPGETVTSMSGTGSGRGYWLFTNRGRVLHFGDAAFFGDMRNTTLHGAVIASVATPTSRGYYMVGSDGGVFTFGDAVFRGSMGGSVLNRPVVGISPTPDNNGYWLVASDGGVFAFHAPFRGSMGGTHLNRPINGLIAYGNGYLMVASDGGVFDFSDRPFAGSLAASPPSSPIVGIASSA